MIEQRTENGINFGPDLKENVLENSELFRDVDKEWAFWVGVHWRPFLSMDPHTISGHADYFGLIGKGEEKTVLSCIAPGVHFFIEVMFFHSPHLFPQTVN